MVRASVLAAMVVLVFAAASFFFALAETALFSLSKWQARQLAGRSPRVGGIVLRLLSQPHDLLAMMVLGNTFASAAMLATALWMALNGTWPLAWTVAGLVVLILVGCEVVPKTLAVRRPEQWSLRVARALLWLQTLSLPLRRVAQQINTAILKAVIAGKSAPQPSLMDADYQELLEMAYQHGALAESEKEIILQ